MSTIHCAIDWHASLPDNLLPEMLATSDYWQPDHHTEQRISATPDVRMAKANLLNRPFSERDNVLASECGRYWIVANAHLDNRVELTQKLALDEDNVFCDAEFILKAYETWQEDTAAQLLGDFVFILWDSLKQQVYCARDHFGVKSLFYSLQPDRLVLSNEHKALLASGSGVSRTLSSKWLTEVFMPTVANEFQSPFRAIQSLPAAHQLVINQQGYRCEPYWSLQPQVLATLTDDEYLTRLRELFERAIARRLVSQFPMAAELSEGLDSNGVVGYASRLLADKPLYTMSFDGVALNDANAQVWSAVYQELFDAMALWPNVVPLWSDAVPETLKAGAHSQTFGGPSNISSWFGPRCVLAQSQGCRTILSGWGGDHCVSGYGDEYVYELFSSRQYFALYRLLKQRMHRGRGGKPIKSLLKIALQHGCPAVYRNLFQYRNKLAKQSAELFNHSILDPSLLAQLTDPIQPYHATIERSSVRERDYRELVDVGVQKRLAFTEISARHFRCEFRYPLLDKDLVEFAYSLPGHLKCKNGIERYMFREVLTGHTTERIRMRRKADVLTTMDINKMRDNALQQLSTVLTQWTPALDRIFDKSALERIVQYYPHVAERYLLVIDSLQQQLKTGAIDIDGFQ